MDDKILQSVAASMNLTKKVLGNLDIDVPGYSAYRNMYVLILFGMAVFAIPLNFAVAVVLVQRHFWKSNVYILLFQLAIADLLVAAFCMVGDAVWNITLEWFGGDLLCRLYKFTQMFSLYASTFILTGISIDRCVAVLFPLSRSGSRGRQFRVKCLSTAAWAAAAVCATPQAFLFHIEVPPFDPNFWQCVTHGSYTEKWQEVTYNSYTVAMMFFVPVLVMTFCYMAIFARITKESRYASGPGDSAFLTLQQASVRRTLYSRVRKQTLWMTLIFVLCFVICWAPYYVGMFCFLLKINIENEAFNLIFCLGMCSAIINPIIYASFNVCGLKKDSVTQSSIKFTAQQQPRQCLIKNTNGKIRGQVKNLYDPAYPFIHAGTNNQRLVITFKQNQRHR